MKIYGDNLFHIHHFGLLSDKIKHNHIMIYYYTINRDSDCICDTTLALFLKTDVHRL